MTCFLKQIELLPNAMHSLKDRVSILHNAILADQDPKTSPELSCNGLDELFMVVVLMPDTAGFYFETVIDTVWPNTFHQQRPMLGNQVVTKISVQEQRRAFRGPWGLSVWCLRQGGCESPRSLEDVTNGATFQHVPAGAVPMHPVFWNWRTQIAILSYDFPFFILSPSHPCLDMFCNFL